jgi:meso-butanediol dehydrogenase/(S,S)-butanediol dehydrogenase/diacetyl reductase
MKLKDRVAIVTGASSGIGRGIALELAREGAKVVVSDITEVPRQGKYHEQDTTTTTVSEIEKLGGEAIFVVADVSDERQVRALVQASIDRYGRLDILVNNAGIYFDTGAVDTASEDWDRLIGINLKGVFLGVKYALPHLRRSPAGRVINIASVHSFGGGGGPAYASAKAGVLNMTRDTAVEAASDGVTANTICPGYIETAIQDALTPEQVELADRVTPLPRLGLPWDIGRAAVFFASDDAQWITGTALPVDGGLLAPVMPGY